LRADITLIEKSFVSLQYWLTKNYLPMKKFLMFGIVAAIALAGYAFNYALEDARLATPPLAKSYGATTLTNSATVYHTLSNNQGEALWFPKASSISVQVYYDEVSGSASATLTLQGTNQIDAASPRWVDVYSIPTAWTADTDTLLAITPVYALYRLKMAQTGTAVGTLTSAWVVQ
jgi:hypothetical protein